jgi:plasmid maintenance system antidote protein VapI
MSQVRATNLLGWSRAQFNEFVYGPRGPPTHDMAVSLAHVVGIPAESWLRYDAVYRADLAARDNEATAGRGLITLPVAEHHIAAAAQAISPNPARWLDSVPTVRRVIATLQSAQERP